MAKGKNYGGLDVFRLVASVMVVAIHTYPLLSISETADLMLTRVIGRLAVPFFFMLSGFFVLGPYSVRQDFIETMRVKRFLMKNGWLYLGISLLYVPLALYSGWYSIKTSVFQALKLILFDGTFYHLWYLPAILIGMVLCCFLIKSLGFKRSLLIALALYSVGLMGDSYSRLLAIGPIKQILAILEIFSSYTRNGFFFAPIFLLLGALIYRESLEKRKWSQSSIIKGLLISLGLLVIEGGLLHLGGEPKHDSMYLSLLPGSYFLFLFLMNWQARSFRGIKKLSLWVYFLHPVSIVLVRLVAKVLRLEKWLITASVLHFFSVLLLTVLLAKVAMVIQRKLKSWPKKKITVGERAWKEVSPGNVLHNLKELQRILGTTQVMAVIKDDGYGHGSQWLAKLLAKAGVQMMAVATLAEGIALRQAGITTDILILGYTPANRACDISYYQLIQTVVNQAHSQQLIDQKLPLRVHLKLDTGMHRLGFQPKELSALVTCYRSLLQVEGIYSHLGSSDSLDPISEGRTRQQIKAFDQVIERLEEYQLKVGIRHLQSSYGVVNYPELRYDYARVGILLYGSHSQVKAVTKVSIKLAPVLRLKSRVIDIKEISQGELIGYGNQLRSSRPMILAIISIGYGDGLPRGLSNQGVVFDYQGQDLKQIGTICMDMLIVDVTDVSGLKLGSIVTVLGEQLTAEEMATKNQTLTNEIYSRLGTRLELN